MLRRAGGRKGLWATVVRKLHAPSEQPGCDRAVLRLYACGRWRLGRDEAAGLLDLAHVWHAYAWLSLRFLDPARPESGPIEVTCWKFAMSAQDWRELCVCVARQLAMPGRALSKESP
jgi:hypothetical protein